MKATLVLMLVLCLLLPGCAADVPEATETSTSEATTVPPVPETQPSLYDPKAPVEQQTAGAVRAYPLDENCSGIAFMGKQLLLFFNDGFGPTLLSRLDTDNERVEQTVELSGSVPFGNVQVTDKKCAYYSTLENCVIVLDDSLRESFRVSLPEGMVGAPVIREDMTEAYYCTGTEIRAVNLETGLSRLLRQRDCLQLSVDAVLFQDTVLRCTVTEADGLSYTEFFSADTGESLGSDADLLMMDSWASDYLLLRTEGAIQECVFGTVGGVQQCITPQTTDGLCGVLSISSAVTVSNLDDGGICLQLYDLTGGKMTSEIQINSLSNAAYITADPTGHYLWFVSKDSRGNDTLYRWDLSASSVSEETVYTDQRYTASSPDFAGLARCRAYADSLERQYGVEIQIENNMTLSREYAYTYEYHVQAFNLGLKALEKALSCFPEDFFVTLGQLSESEKICISLVRSMTGRTSDVPQESVGAQYWDDGSAHIILSIGDTTERAFYNELSLVLDTYILNESLAYDDWEQWNPDSFSYDGNYKDYVARDDMTWLEGEDRAFVDAFSMTFPREDRARILEFAMLEGNEDVFRSETMQNKLYQICKGIRDAFGWKKDERAFPWEQYLKEPLAYTTK